MSSEQIKHMVNRFLQWKLPENFNPDGGISFKKTFNENSQWGPMKHEPVGTNLFDAFQAEAMVRYMVDGLPAERRTASMSERVKIVSHDGSWWIQEYGGLTQGPFTRRIAEDILSKIVQRGCCRGCPRLSAELEQVKAERDRLELKYRQQLWLEHGHITSLYGDDGEMQCCKCHPWWDYKRSPLDKLEEMVQIAKLARLRAAEAALGEKGK